MEKTIPLKLRNQKQAPLELELYFFCSPEGVPLLCKKSVDQYFEIPDGVTEVDLVVSTKKPRTPNAYLVRLRPGWDIEILDLEERGKVVEKTTHEADRYFTRLGLAGRKLYAQLKY